MCPTAEPIYDIAHLAHVELLTPKPDQSLWFFTQVLSLQEVGRRGQSVYLRTYGDYQRYSLKLTESKQAGLGHAALRTTSAAALDRRVVAIAATEYARLGRRRDRARPGVPVYQPGWPSIFLNALGFRLSEHVVMAAKPPPGCA